MIITAATRHYRGMFENRTPEELNTLAHVKRFMERLCGDHRFREALAEHVDEPIIAARKFGVDVDPLELLPLWRSTHLRYRGSDYGREHWPKADAWDRWIKQMIRHRDLIRDTGTTAESHPRFDRWRMRQMNRSTSELGDSADAVVHPVIAFELSEGCTVGCWFCGLSADRFAGHVAYTDEMSGLWRGVLGEVNDLFGTAAQTGFCYWATDPCDNPDYDRFIEDYYHTTGALPQTTTAAPLKDIELTRRIFSLFDRYRTVTNRFSVLTVKHLDKIHAAFTAEELLGVELVMQNREALSSKATAGRARDRIMKLRAAGKPDKIAKLELDHTTIACVSGFLVSMVQRTIKLVSPVPGSERYPLGYRVFGERTFTDAASFRVAVEDLIDTHMPESVPRWWPARFRADLAYEPHEGGFLLRSRCAEHIVRNPALGEKVGRLLNAGDLTVGEVMGRLIDDGANVFSAADLMDTIFFAGLLEEPDMAAAGAAPAEELAVATTA